MVVGMADHVNQCLGGNRPHPLYWLPDGCKGWIQKRGSGYIVEASNGDILRNLLASLAQGAHRPYCHSVARDKDSIRLKGQEPLHCRVAALFRKLTFDNQVVVAGNLAVG